MPRTELKERAGRIYERLRETHPDAHCELDYSNPLELLVATILSAQCTDARVNQVTAELFSECGLPQDYLALSTEELEERIRSTGFFRQKAKSIQGVMQALVDEHDGQVPADLESLTALPGVGRKTANVVLGNAFGVPGITVDTHVFRVSRRLGLSRGKDADKVEQSLMRLYPPDEWVMLSHTFIFHGRRVCTARKPACDDCPVLDDCPFGQRQIDGKNKGGDSD